MSKFPTFFFIFFKQKKKESFFLPFSSAHSTSKTLCKLNHLIVFNSDIKRGRSGLKRVRLYCFYFWKEIVKKRAVNRKMNAFPKRPIHVVTTWVHRQPPKVKAFLGVVSAMTALVFLRMIVHDHDNLFVAAEAVHALGISVLIYKLTKEKTCAGNQNPSCEKLSNFIDF